jgi:ABC-type glutathione transport system ATPase component
MGEVHNPFSSCHVEPGAIPWVGDLERLYRRWHELGGRAQIVGPHGSGKTTLVTHLIARAARDGWAVAVLDDPAARTPLRLALARLRHRHLLVAAHRDLGLPTLLRTSVSLATAFEVVTHLLRDAPGSRPSRRELTELLELHEGNLRRVLFDLYDRYEGRSCTTAATGQRSASRSSG